MAEGRMMALDYGLRRIGIAITDPLQITISPFDTVASTSLKHNAQTILKIAVDNNVIEIVIGLPINMSGTEGTMAKTVRQFADELKALTDIPIALINESLSTMEAEELMINKGIKVNNKDKGIKDKIAAALIGQRFLESKCTI
jgi:putative Holliday junction resolvase